MPKNLEGLEICCTFASAFAQKRASRQSSKSSLKELHNREVVQEAMAGFQRSTFNVQHACHWVEEETVKF